MDNRYAIIQYDDDVADYNINEEFDKITFGNLSTFETPTEATAAFDKVMASYGFNPVETSSQWDDLEKIVKQYIDAGPTSNDKYIKGAAIRMLSVIAMAQIGQARAAELNNEIMAAFLGPGQ